MADGFYRVRAARQARLTKIKALVYEGSKRDALIYAVGANESHGLRRTPEDRRKSVVILLDDPEWCLWTDAEIARICRVTAAMVARVREGSPGLKGHGVRARVQRNGVVRHTAAPEVPESVDRRTFERPPVLMTRGEIIAKFEKKLFNHIKRSEKDAKRDVGYAFGTVEIASSKTLYAIALVTDRMMLYTVVGRMIVAREAMNSKARIVIIGHFPRTVGNIIEVLADELGIQCLTPEQVLSS